MLSLPHQLQAQVIKKSEKKSIYCSSYRNFLVVQLYWKFTLPLKNTHLFLLKKKKTWLTY